MRCTDVISSCNALMLLLAYSTSPTSCVYREAECVPHLERAADELVLCIPLPVQGALWLLNMVPRGLPELKSEGGERPALKDVCLRSPWRKLMS